MSYNFTTFRMVNGPDAAFDTDEWKEFQVRERERAREKEKKKERKREKDVRFRRALTSTTRGSRI